MLQLSLTPCILNAQETNENVVSLREDQPAPGDGYWTEPMTFRQMLTDVKQGRVYKSEFEKCMEEKQTPVIDSRAMWFGGGVFVTLLTIFAVSSIVKK